MSSKVEFKTVSPEEAGQRLDNFLIRVLKKAPKSLIYRIIRKGEVRVNKGRAKPERKLQTGDVVRVPPVRLETVKAPAKLGEGLSERLRDAVLYEDDGLLVVNKPAGLAVHGGSGVNLGLVEALRQLRDDRYLELVHRLDKGTSGCVMLAKKRSVLRAVHQLLREKKDIQKQYLALVKGCWPKRCHSVNAPLERLELKNGDRMVKVSQQGKTAKTLFSIETEFEYCTLVRARPITGRTHQIRVHAQHMQHPLIGDEKYGDDGFNARLREFGARRLFLHAASLSFSLDGEEQIHVEAPLPDDLSSVLDRLAGSDE